MGDAWWQGFFDDDYLRIWGPLFSPEESAKEARRLIELLALQAGARVLDAPCGFGRLSAPLAERGLEVCGIDFSQELVDTIKVVGGTFVVADLRHGLPADEAFAPASFDAAIHMFSSLGYGSEDDDVAALRTIKSALKPGAPLFIDTMHRDAVIARMARGETPGRTLPDGTRFWETPALDPVEGRVHTTWYWDGPLGKGQKSASIRIYTVTELVALVRRAGFDSATAHVGTARDPMGGSLDELSSRLGLLCR